MKLVAPIGPRLAMRLAGDGRRIVDDALRTKVDVARVRRARLLVPVDTLPEPTVLDWALVAAYNDLLQATNHHLSGAFTRSRHETLVAAVNQLLDVVGPPAGVLEAVSRHATFAKALDVIRTDTRVRWWAGSASFRGEPPAARLLSWRELRRVHVEPHTVHVSDLPDGVSSLSPEGWNAALSLWLTRSPLTDLATITRSSPAFAWSLPTLALVKSPRGRVLATRVLARVEARALESALDKALSKIPADAPVRPLVASFATEVLARVKGGEVQKDEPSEPTRGGEAREPSAPARHDAGAPPPGSSALEEVEVAADAG
jgi:hypothetical protein